MVTVVEKWMGEVEKEVFGVRDRKMVEDCLVDVVVQHRKDEGEVWR